MDSIFEQRLKDLEDHIQQDINLRKQYEDNLRYEDDPRRMAKYQREIERITKSAQDYQNELNTLKTQIGDDINDSLSFNSRLDNIDNQLNFLCNSSVAIYQNINNLQNLILERFEDHKKSLLSSITQKLDQNQLSTVNLVLEALDTQKLSESETQQLLEGTRKLLDYVQSNQLTTIPNNAEIVQIINDPELDARHRLKIAIPVIPFLIEYESEIELGTGFNLKNTWQILKTKFQRGE